jgi:hypothetical protein
MRTLVRVDTHFLELALQRANNLASNLVELVTLFLSQAFKSIRTFLHLLGGGGGSGSGLGEADDGHTAIGGRLLARDVFLFLKLCQQLREGLLTHVKEVGELALGRLWLCGKKGKNTTLPAQGIAKRAVAMRLCLVVPMDEHAHAAHFAS